LTGSRGASLAGRPCHATGVIITAMSAPFLIDLNVIQSIALGGLYPSLGPSLAAQETGSPNLLWGGLVIFLLCGTGAAAAFALRSIRSRACPIWGGAVHRFCS
jgi:hypothetical protein